jgi:hypothetical protein
MGATTPTPEARALSPIKAGEFSLPEDLVQKIHSVRAVSAKYFSYCSDTSKPKPSNWLTNMPLCSTQLATRSSSEISVPGPQDRDAYQNIEIGNMKLSWEVSTTTSVSVIGRQKAGSFVPYTTEDGHVIYDIVSDNLTADEMLTKLADAKREERFTFRIVFFFVMWLGLFLILHIEADYFQATLCDQINSFFISFLITLFFCVITIALAWNINRPVVAVPLFLLAPTAPTVYCFKKRGTKKKAAKAGMDSSGVPLESIGMRPDGV